MLLPQGQRPPDTALRAKRFQSFQRACPEWPFTEDELDDICRGVGVALCCPCAGAGGVEMIVAGGGPLSRGALVRQLNAVQQGWVFRYDADYLGGCVRGGEVPR